MKKKEEHEYVLANFNNRDIFNVLHETPFAPAMKVGGVDFFLTSYRNIKTKDVYTLLFYTDGSIEIYSHDMTDGFRI